MSIKTTFEEHQPRTKRTGEVVFLTSLREHLQHRLNPEIFQFLDNHLTLSRFSLPEAELLNTRSQPEIHHSRDFQLRILLNLHRINDVRRLNKYFLKVHKNLDDNGIFVGVGETITTHRERFFSKFPAFMASILYVLNFMYRRIMPKIYGLNRLYFALSKGRNRVLSRAEILGRLYYCGFKVLALKQIGGQTVYIAQKWRAPREGKPSYGPLIKLKRIGTNGDIFYIYKIRTMYPYSEYLQQYIYDHNHLESNGKFKRDFRVTEWGAFLRKYWLDELPQLINWLKGDMRLVGVRALSEHYFKLYPQHIRKMRLGMKPGLIPPFYCDLPDSFEEIIESEQRYILQKKQRPFYTDFIYFCKALTNILFRRARSA